MHPTEASLRQLETGVKKIRVRNLIVEHRGMLNIMDFGLLHDIDLRSDVLLRLMHLYRKRHIILYHSELFLIGCNQNLSYTRQKKSIMKLLNRCGIKHETVTQEGNRSKSYLKLNQREFRKLLEHMQSDLAKMMLDMLNLFTEFLMHYQQYQTEFLRFVNKRLEYQTNVDAILMRSQLKFLDRYNRNTPIDAKAEDVVEIMYEKRREKEVVVLRVKRREIALRMYQQCLMVEEEKSRRIDVSEKIVYSLICFRRKSDEMERVLDRLYERYEGKEEFELMYSGSVYDEQRRFIAILRERMDGKVWNDYIWKVQGNMINLLFTANKRNDADVWLESTLDKTDLSKIIESIKIDIGLEREKANEFMRNRETLYRIVKAGPKERARYREGEILLALKKIKAGKAEELTEPDKTVLMRLIEQKEQLNFDLFRNDVEEEN